MSVKKKGQCRCQVRGIFQMWKKKKETDNFVYSIPPWDYQKYLRKFVFCPICGNKYTEHINELKK